MLCRRLAIMCLLVITLTACQPSPAAPPTFDTSIPLSEAMEQFPELGDLAPEAENLSDKDFTSFEDGDVLTLTVAMDGSQTVFWRHFWCARDEETLQDNLSKIEFSFVVDGEPIPLSEFATSDYSDWAFLNLACLSYYAVLSDWPKGEHVLRKSWTFLEPVHNGIYPYPAGTLHIDTTVTVSR